MSLYNFSSTLILFGSKNFYIDNIIEKVVCVVFYIYKIDFITHFYNAFIKIKLLLIHYLCREMKINVFVLLDILSNNSKYSSYQ